VKEGIKDRLYSVSVEPSRKMSIYGHGADKLSTVAVNTDSIPTHEQVEAKELKD